VKFLFMQPPPLFHYLVPVRSTYPQHPILKHPLPMFLPQCVRPSITSIKKRTHNYISVHYSLYILIANWKTEGCGPSGSRHFLN
jgi:hypothetical protein